MRPINKIRFAIEGRDTAANAMMMMSFGSELVISINLEMSMSAGKRTLSLKKGRRLNNIPGVANTIMTTKKISTDAITCKAAVDVVDGMDEEIK